MASSTAASRASIGVAGSALVDHALQHRSRVGPREWRLPGQHLVEQGPQAIDIAALIHLVGLSPRLLRRHVGRRAEHLALQGRRKAWVGGRTGNSSVGRYTLKAPGAGGQGAWLERLLRRIPRRCAGYVVQILGESPVEENDFPEIAQDHVGPLEISMDHAAHVGKGDRLTDGREGDQQPAARAGQPPLT